MRKFLLTAPLAAAVLVGQAALAAPSSPHNHHAAAAAASTPDNAKLDATKAALRDLWIGHIFWVRNVVIDALAGNTAAQQASEAQVVANAHAIAGAIQPFYGAAATDKLFTLLAGHYGAIKAYLDASIAHNTQKQAEATNALMHNATQIAVFLSTANPYLPKDTVEALLDAHASQHMTEIQQLQAGNYAGEAKTWSEMIHHIYVISDVLAGAIAKQFPAKFQDGA